VWHSARVPHPNPSDIASDQTTPEIILETLIAWGGIFAHVVELAGLLSGRSE
jgi:hypothetical protein